MQVIYKATVTSTSGRDGRAVSSDKLLDVQRSTPRD
jgi:osmotically inducible protein OsmC